MNITHVVRGEDHISNTAKQILLYKSLNQGPERGSVSGPEMAPKGGPKGVPILDQKMAVSTRDFVFSAFFCSQLKYSPFLLFLYFFWGRDALLLTSFSGGC